MEGKKRYIAIILFLLIGLGIFTFASTPEEEYGNSKGDNTNIQQTTTTTTRPVDKDVLAQETEDEEETNNNRRPTSSSTEEDDSYELALEAVKELEKVLSTEQAETAKDLVEAVTNTTQYEELMNRVTIAENAITAEMLVKELEKMVADALAKADIETAVVHRDEKTQPAVDSITGEELVVVRESLVKRIEVLNKILNDNTKPEIKGIKDGANVNTDVTLTITDENEVTKKVTKDGSEYDYKDIFTEEGTYEVTVLDSAFNENTITFTIDKTDPIIEGVENGVNVNTDVTLTIRDTTFTTKKVTKDGEEYEYKDTFTKEGTYVVVVTDDAGNDSEITFTIDKTPAKFLGLTSREAYVDSYTVKVEDATKVTIMIKKNHAKDWSEIEEGTEISEEGTYQILAKDAAGNTSDTWVIIDATYPTIEGIEGTLVNKAQTITVFDRYLYTVEINGKKYTRSDFTHNVKNENHKFVITLSEEGVYTIVAKDKSGKTTTETFEIDTKFAGIASANMYTNGKNYMIDKVPYYYAQDGNTITAYIRTKEQLGQLPTFTFNVNGKDYPVDGVKESFHKKEDKEAGIYKYEVKFKLTEEVEMEDGELTFTVTNIVDKAGNTKETPVKGVTNKNVNIVDRKSASVRSNDFYVSGLKEIDKVFYTTKGNKVVINIKTYEQLRQIPTFTLHNNGEYYVLTDVLDRGENAPGVWLYQASYEISDEMADGEITFTISDIYDLAGNKTADVTKASNHRRIILDNTPATRNYSTLRFDENIISEKKDGIINYYINNNQQFEFAIAFDEALSNAPIVTIGGKSVEMKFNKGNTFRDDKRIYLYEGKVSFKEEDDITDGILDINVSNVIDLAGNIATDIKVVNQTPTSNHRVVFYDTTAPVVTPSYTEDIIAEDSIDEYTKEPEFTIEDNSGQEVTKELVFGKVNPQKLGTYELVYRFTDILGNYTDVTITVNVLDTLPPNISEVIDGAFYTTKVNPIVKDKNLKDATITHKVLGKELYTKKFISGSIVYPYGEFTINAKDTSGNQASVTFVIDNVKPKILLLDKLEYIQSDIIPIKPIVIEEYLDTITITREYKDALNQTHKENIEFKVEKVIEDGKVISKITNKDGNGLTANGRYEIIAKDKAGNTEIAIFTIDNENPVILQNVLNGGVYKEFSLVVLDENYDEENVIVLEKTKSISGPADIELPYYEKYELPSDRKITEEGEYLIVVYDKAYNISVARVLIDKTSPTSNIEQNGIYRELTPVVEDENLDADSVKVYKNNKKVDFTLGDTITTAGEYRLEAYDKARNELIIYFIIDREPPVIKAPSISAEIGARTEKLDVTTTALDNIDGEIIIKPTVTKEYNGSKETLYDVTELDISTPGVKYTLVYNANDKVGNITETPVTVEFTVVEVTYEFVYSGKITKVYDKDDSLAAIKEKIVFNKVEGGNVTKIDDATIDYTITKDGEIATTVQDAGDYVIIAKTIYNEEEYEITINYTVQKAILTVNFKDLVYGDTTSTVANQVELINQNGDKLDVETTITLYKYEDVYIPWFGGKQKYVGTFPVAKSNVEEGKYFYTVLVVANDNYEINDKVTVDLYLQKLDVPSASKSVDYTVVKTEEE